MANENGTIYMQGFIASGVAFAVQIWCTDHGGPVFMAVYQSVQTLVVAIMASLTLGEKFYLGGIIGAALIITGLYLVLWGKSEERSCIGKEAAVMAAGSAASSGDGEREVWSAKLGSSITQPLLPPSSTTSDNV